MNELPLITPKRMDMVEATRIGLSAAMSYCGVLARKLVPLIAMTLVAGCGGDPAPGGSGGTGGTGGTGGSGTSGPLAIALRLADSSGASVTQLAAGQAAGAEAVLRRNGVPVANEIVTFSVAGGLASIAPTSGAVLTDASGLARVSVTASDTLAGATTLSASATVSGQSTSASTNFSVGLSGAGNLKISALTVSVGSTGLSAYGTASIAASVVDLNGAAPSKPVTVTFSTSCPAGKATITASASTLPNGTVQATFTDAGCAQTAPIDATITAAIPSDTKSQTIRINSPSSGSLQFVSANPSDRSITLKGQGGNGRQESATLNFRLVDLAGNGVSDTDVCFDATTYVGGLNVDGFNDVNAPTAPGSVALCGSDNTLRYVKRTGGDGTVTVQVNSGTTPTPVRVRARTLYPASSTTRLETVSDSLSISTGLPLQRSFDLSFLSSNLECRNISARKPGHFTARLADQFGNPVPDGTVVNFITSGGAVCSSSTGSCTTANGECTCDYICQEPRPADGRAVILAFTVGLEDYVDNNGNNVYDVGETFTDLSDAFLDADKNGSYTSGVDTCLRYQNPTSCSLSGDSLRGTAHLRRSGVILLGASSSPTVIIPAAFDGGGFVQIPKTNCQAGLVIPVIVPFQLEDGFGNATAAATAIATVSQTPLAAGGVDPAAVPNLILGLSPARDSLNAPKTSTSLSDVTLIGTIHSLTLTPVANTAGTACATGSGNVQIKVTSPSGVAAFAQVLFEGESRSTPRFGVPIQVQ